MYMHVLLFSTRSITPNSLEQCTHTRLRGVGSGEVKGAFHYAKISGNFGQNINGTHRCRWKFTGKKMVFLQR